MSSSERGPINIPVVNVVVSASSSTSVRTSMRVEKKAEDEGVAPGNAALLSLIDDPELLSLIAMNLAANEQCALACSAKLLHLVVSECQREISFMHSAVTDSVEEARASVLPQLKAPPSFGLMFANPGGEQPRKKLKSLVKALPPSMHWVGGEVGTLVGTTPAGGFCAKHAEGYALSLGSFPEATTGSFTVQTDALR